MRAAEYLTNFPAARAVFQRSILTNNSEMGELDTLQVAPSLRKAADEILASAGIALEGLNAEKPSDAVHDYRVAFKRWRALLRLLQGQFGDEIVALRREARLLSRTFDRSRDAQAALDALADIAGPKTISTPSISERTRATIADRLEGIRKTSEIIALDTVALERLHVGLARAIACASAWPLERMTFDVIVTALARSHRRARRRLSPSWETMSAEDVHEFRKAVVTFRYQIELIEPLWPKMWRTFTGEVQKLRVQLGKSNDLVVLGRLTQPKQPLAHWRSRLALPIETQRQYHLNRARILATRIFAESPRSFQKRIEAMSKAATAVCTESA